MKEQIIKILNGLRPEFDFGQEGVDFIEEGMLDSFDIVALVSELDRLAAVALPEPEVPVRVALRHPFFGLGDRQLGRTGRRLLPFSGIIARPLQHRELRIVRRGIRTEEIIVAVRA